MNYQHLDAIVASYRDELLEKLKSWIAIPSVQAPKSADNAPFGPEVRRMLDRFLADARAMDFDVRDFDGYCAHAQMGKGEKDHGHPGAPRRGAPGRRLGAQPHRRRN
jgi:acetylornithine deacetylase/succinyl-diaminopimelate desuccinylase-like protein